MTETALLLCGWPLWAVLPLAGGLGVAAWHIYRREIALLRSRAGKALVWIRIAILVLLALTLLEPVIKRAQTIEEQGRTIVAVDCSLSMALNDARSPGYYKVRLADSLGILPKGARDRSGEEAAAAARKLAAEQGGVRDELELLRRDLRDSAGWGKELAARVERLRDSQARVVAGAKGMSQDLSKLMADFAKQAADPKAVPAGLAKQAPEVKRALADAEAKAGLAAKLLADLPGAAEPKKRVDMGSEALKAQAEAAAAMASLAQVLDAVQRELDDRLAQSAEPAVAKAIEEIGSMSRLDMAKRIVGDRKGGLVASLGERFRVVGCALAEEPQAIVFDGEDPMGGIVASSPYTDLVGPLKRQVDAHRQEPLAGVVLLTDGRHNRGGDPVQAAAAFGANRLPVYVVGLGSPEPLKDIALVAAEANDTVFLEDQVVVDVSVKSEGYDGIEVPVILRRGEDILDQQKLKLTARRRQHVVFRVPADVPGDQRYSVFVPLQDGEAVTTNNEKALGVRVIQEKIKALYLDGPPRWEERFLRTVLERDKCVEANVLLANPPDPERKQLPRGQGKGRFPETRDRLFEYDVVILGDVDPNVLAAKDIENVKAFVARRGGALIVICGETFMPYAYRSTPIEEILPVNLRDEGCLPWEVKARWAEGFRPALTPDGERSPLTRLSVSQDVNRELWKLLPAMHWYCPIREAKPGATVLAYNAAALEDRPAPEGKPEAAPGAPARPPAAKKMADDAAGGEPGEDARRREGREALIATHFFGAGKVVYLGMDSTWRWRFKVGDKYFHRFWGQMLRACVSERLSGGGPLVRVGSDKARYQRGETAIVTAKLLAAEGVPVENGLVNAVFASEGGGQEKSVRLRYVPDSGGIYRGSLPDLQPGRMAVRLAGAALPADAPTAEAAFEVGELDTEEYVDLDVNQPLLRQIAASSGGGYYPACDAARLPGDIRDLTRHRTIVREIELWDSIYLLALFGALAIAEWLIRKRNGLI